MASQGPTLFSGTLCLFSTTRESSIFDAMCWWLPSMAIWGATGTRKGTFELLQRNSRPKTWRIGWSISPTTLFKSTLRIMGSTKMLINFLFRISVNTLKTWDLTMTFTMSAILVWWYLYLYQGTGCRFPQGIASDHWRQASRVFFLSFWTWLHDWRAFQHLADRGQHQPLPRAELSSSGKAGPLDAVKFIQGGSWPHIPSSQRLPQAQGTALRFLWDKQVLSDI